MGCRDFFLSFLLCVENVKGYVCVCVEVRCEIEGFGCMERVRVWLRGRRAWMRVSGLRCELFCDALDVYIWMERGDLWLKYRSLLLVLLLGLYTVIIF